MNMMSILWLCAMVVFGIAEAATVALTSIWFAVGALAAAVAALFGAQLWLQILIFAAVSLVCVLALRPLAKTRFGGSRKVATNADRLIGQEAMVREVIDNISGTGAVTVGGAIWTARCDTDAVIPPGTLVRILRIEGVKLIVTPQSAAPVQTAAPQAGAESLSH